MEARIVLTFTEDGGIVAISERGVSVSPPLTDEQRETQRVKMMQAAAELSDATLHVRGEFS